MSGSTLDSPATMFHVVDVQSTQRWLKSPRFKSSFGFAHMDSLHTIRNGGYLPNSQVGLSEASWFSRGFTAKPEEKGHSSGGVPQRRHAHVADASHFSRQAGDVRWFLLAAPEGVHSAPDPAGQCLRVGHVPRASGQKSSFVCFEGRLFGVVLGSKQNVPTSFWLPGLVCLILGSCVKSFQVPLGQKEVACFLVEQRVGAFKIQTKL